MKRCYQCKGDKLDATTVEESRTVAGRTFTGTVPAIRCASCGELYYPGPALEALDLEVAGELARHGEASAEALRFMRKALALKASEIAELLDVTRETVSRWEHGQQPVERRAAALLSAMVRDKLDGRTSTLDSLRALLKPDPLPTLVRLVPHAA